MLDKFYCEISFLGCASLDLFAHLLALRQATPASIVPVIQSSVLVSRRQLITVGVWDSDPLWFGNRDLS